MHSWPHKLYVWNLSQIHEAIADSRWQKFRISMKGVPTETKLDMLQDYLNTMTTVYECEVEDLKEVDWKEQCRIDNYINALKRGGQLNVGGEVQR